jgi:PAS domain S-box-containing protein
MPRTHASRSPLMKYRQALLVLLSGLLLSSGLAVWVSVQVEQQVEKRFQQLSERQNERILQRFNLYAVGLRGMRGLFLENPESVSADDFLQYTRSLDILSEFPGTLGWSYVERLRAADAVMHLHQHHNLNYRQAPSLQGPQDDEAWVVRLIAPGDINSAVLGMDIRGEKRRYGAALSAMLTGQVTLSAPITLVQDQQPGLIMTLPVFRAEAHQDNVTGWVSAIMHSRDALGFLNDEAGLADMAGIQISDITTGMEPVYELPHRSSASHISDKRMRSIPKLDLRTEINVAGRRWEVRYLGRSGIYTEADRWLPALTLALGTLLSLLVAGMLLFSIRLRLSAEERARTMTSSLRERESLLQSTLSSLNDWVLVLDADGIVRECHEPVQQSGWQTREDFLGKPLAKALPPTVQLQLEAELRQVQQQGQARFEFDLPGAAGQFRHLTMRLTARRDADGNIDGMTAMVHDATLEREKARELSVSEQKFRLLFAEAGQAILLTRQDRYVDANPAALELFGIPNIATLQHASLGVISPLVQPDGSLSRSSIQALMQRTVEEGPQHYEWTFQRLSDGSTFPADVRTSSLEINGEAHFLSSISDLSSHKQNETTLIQARDAAEAATREKSEFLATMSHEIRTPMNGVLGMAQLLANTSLNTEQREYLNTIQQSGQALLTIINDILDFSKIEAGKLSFEEAPFDLQIAVDDTCELLLPQIRDKNLALRINMDANTPLHVIGDAGRFRQILLNYLSNALKFTERGGITVGLRARETGRGACLFELSVADTGIGITAEKQELLFQKFAQADTTTTRRFGGTGLGLAICKALVERMGGEVSMSSTPGHGSTFRASFWMSLDPRADRQILPVILPALRNAPVLIIDDAAPTRALLAKGLGRLGLAVNTADSIGEAISTIRENPPRFVLLNAELHGGDAGSLIRALREQPGLQQAMLILLSSRPERNDHAFCRANGISAYLPKPARISWIISTINIIASGEHDGVVTRQTLISHHARGRALPELRHGIRVLLAEDNAVNQKVAARMLEKMGCRVDMAGNGLEALVMMSQLPYDLILMDVQMPEMDGITATRRLRAQGYSEIPVIALTANSRDSDRQECRAAGMSDFLAKPIKYEDLHSCLSKWI